MEAFWQSRSLVNPPEWVSRDGIDLAYVDVFCRSGLQTADDYQC
jgi:hypothetical protein